MSVHFDTSSLERFNVPEIADIRSWISEHFPSKMWGENTYPFLNFNSAVVGAVTGHNGHTPKRPQLKRPRTEAATDQMATYRNGHRPKSPQTETATNRNGRKPERPLTETATDRNGHKPKRPQTGTATNRNGQIGCHPPHQLSPE